MTVTSVGQLREKKCAPCEGGVPRLSIGAAAEQIKELNGWRVTDDGRRIRKDWRMKDFVAGIEFIKRVADLAETEGHHPDLHLEGYRNVWIEVSTHAIGGLSENDFILAAKIEQLKL